MQQLFTLQIRLRGDANSDKCYWKYLQSSTLGRLEIDQRFFLDQISIGKSVVHSYDFRDFWKA